MDKKKSLAVALTVSVGMLFSGCSKPESSKIHLNVNEDEENEEGSSGGHYGGVYFRGSTSESSNKTSKGWSSSKGSSGYSGSHGGSLGS